MCLTTPMARNRSDASKKAHWHLGQVLSGSIGELETRRIAEEDWANAWKEYYHVLHLGRRTVIKPILARVLRRARTRWSSSSILAWPSGRDFTPRPATACSRSKRAFRPGNAVLDVGTGSGILATAAIKLGAARVLALDVSGVAVEAARENAAINGVSDAMEVRMATLEGADGEPFMPLPEGLDTLGEEIGVFDVVVANIIARVIAQLAPSLVRAVRPGGTLIASGIIAERRAEAEEPLRAAGLRDIREMVEGDWVTLVGTRPAGCGRRDAGE